jgi:hypothetical protein
MATISDSVTALDLSNPEQIDDVKQTIFSI